MPNKPLDYLDLDDGIPEADYPDPPQPPTNWGGLWEDSPQGWQPPAGTEDFFESVQVHQGDDGDDPTDVPGPRLYGEEIEDQIKRPLIFVPGIMGSTLAHVDVRQAPNGQERRYLGHNLWPPIHTGHGTGSTRTHAIENLTKRPKVPTGLFPFVYNDLIKFLVDEMGYELDKTLFIFPYDWTQSNKISGRKLAGFIKRLIAGFNFGSGVPEEVDVINHSMGGIVTRVAGFMHSAPIRRTVYLASPHYGASKAYFTMHPGIPTPLSQNVIYNYFIENYLQNNTELAGSYPSVEAAMKGVGGELRSSHELLNDDEWFTRRIHMVSDNVASGATGNVVGWNQTYTGHTRARFPTPALRLNATNAMIFKLNLGKNLPGKINLVIYSTDHQTAERKSITGNPAVPDWGPTVTIDGDGTVPEHSATGPGAAVKVPGDHNGVPNNRVTFFWIALFLISAP